MTYTGVAFSLKSGFKKIVPTQELILVLNHVLDNLHRSSVHQLRPLGQVGIVVVMSVCCCPLPMQFFCVVGLVQSVPCPWTGAITISSRALKQGCVPEFDLDLE